MSRYYRSMLQRVREWLALALIVLLPFHALGLTVLTKLIAGPGHAPLPQLAIWKEGVLGVILLIAFIEILQNRKTRKVDLPDILILLLIALAVIVSGLQPSFSLSQFALGVKYDFVPLIALLVLRRVEWSASFKDTAFRALLWVGSIVSLYGIATLFLPDNYFTLLGYSDLHSLYVANGPLAAFQQIGGAALHRVQSTFSGPNQLGIWLLIPISVMLSSSKHVHVPLFDGLRVTQFLLFLIALLLTFSRAAWIGAFVIILIAVSSHACKKSAAILTPTNIKNTPGNP